MLKRLLKIIASAPAITSFWTEKCDKHVGVRTYDIGSGIQIRHWPRDMQIYYETEDIGFVEDEHVSTIYQAIVDRKTQIQHDKLKKFLS